jgi:hypothetical protein
MVEAKRFLSRSEPFFQISMSITFEQSRLEIGMIRSG